MIKIAFCVVSILYGLLSIYFTFKGLNYFEPLVVSLLVGMWAKLED